MRLFDDGRRLALAVNDLVKAHAGIRVALLALLLALAVAAVVFVPAVVAAIFAVFAALAALSLFVALCAALRLFGLTAVALAFGTSVADGLFALPLRGLLVVGAEVKPQPGKSVLDLKALLFAYVLDAVHLAHTARRQIARGRNAALREQFRGAFGQSERLDRSRKRLFVADRRIFVALFARAIVSEIFSHIVIIPPSGQNGNLSRVYERLERVDLGRMR